MNFLHSDLGRRHRGDVVEVTLSSGANVRVLTASEFDKYRRGRDHRYLGGLARKSPVRISLPSSEHWHAVVDMQGLRGSTKAGFRVIPQAATRPLPEIRAVEPEIRAIAENFAALPADASGREFDVFVCHASEDKDGCVRELAAELRACGLSVWFDEFELRIGSSLRRGIDNGIARSRFGVVVLSQSFFAKGWTAYELDGLVTRSIDGRQVLLPIWHGVTKDEVVHFSPSLADKVALRTDDSTVAAIAQKIAAVVHST